jgi:putative ABC transport system substrate-binding protein
MKRRVFLGVLCGATARPLAASAQQNTSKKRLVIFSPAESSAAWRDYSEANRALLVELRRLGQIEGQNFTVEIYGREQDTSGPETLAATIVQSNPDVILAPGPGAVVFKKLTSRIPIVTVTADPVRQGIAETLAHPGGNITGASVEASPTIYGKRIELLREIFPAISKLGCLALRIQYDRLGTGALIAEAAEASGLPIAVALLEIGAKEADWRAAVESMSSQGANAIMVVESPDTFQSSALIVKLIDEAKLPAIYAFSESVEAGGLMAYSFNLIELYKRVANNIDAILRGAKPGDIPFYQVTKFELSINLKTAKRLGLSVPPALTASVDKVIE